MLLLLLLATSATQSNGLDLPPATDPVGRWIASSIAVFAVIGPLIAARIQAKRGGVSNGPGGPAPPVGDIAASTASLDVGKQYLDRLVANLEDQVKEIKAENKDLRAQVTGLIEDRATVRAQLEAMRVDNSDLRDEIHTLRGRLQGNHG